METCSESLGEVQFWLNKEESSVVGVFSRIIHRFLELSFVLSDLLNNGTFHIEPILKLLFPPMP
jgi:hypothetical protein